MRSPVRLSPPALAAAAAALFLLGSPSRADACSCAPRPAEPCEAVWKADAVFVATVTAIEDLPVQRTTFPYRRVQVRVMESLRGDLAGDAEVFTGTGGGDCGFPFDRGKTYLIYAHRQQGTTRLVTSICSRTTQLNAAGADLRYLRRAIDPSARGIVHGTAYLRVPRGGAAYRLSPFPGLRVIAVAAGGAAFETTTGADGRYELDVPAGRYAVGVEAPAGVEATPAFPRVEVRNGRACGELDISVRRLH